MNDPLQDALWCVFHIQRYRARRIRKPRNPVGLIVAELDAIVELNLIITMETSKNGLEINPRT